MADQSSGGGGSGSAAPMQAPITSGIVGMREYRKGNWTLQETMILIEAKKMDDERRLKRSSTTTLGEQHQQQLTTTPGSSQQMTTKAAGELRWKWVEDYCWRKGCFRSQNQCNDKWDNLMRDYKKVRDYQRNLILNPQQQQSSYWNMEKSERKERGLPSNMLPTIYDALVQVVEKKTSSSTSPSPATTTPIPLLPPPPPSSIDIVQQIPSTSGALSLLLQQQQQQQKQVNVAALAPPSYPSQPMLYQTTTATIPLESDTSSDSPAKKRRKEKMPAGEGQSSKDEEGGDMASAMFKISETMQESERRQEERHREMVALKQRRLQIEEVRIEVNRQGMSGVVDAINNLANSILALAAAASNNNGQRAPPPS